MGVRPNLVVGAIGLIVFAVTLSIIVDNWRDLTGTNDYEADVEEFSRPLGERAGSMGAGATETELVEVPVMNLTRFEARLTWQENGGLSGNFDVTLTIRDPAGQIVATETSQGGTAGITMDRTLLAPPVDERFSATEASLESEFDSRYPAHPEGQGTWTFSIRTNQPESTGPTGMTYRLTTSVDYYVVSVTEAEDLTVVR